MNQLLLPLCFFTLMVFIYWSVDDKTVSFIKQAILYFTKQATIYCLAVLGLWFIGEKVERWKFYDKIEGGIGTILERITPLVLLFGIFVILSIPLVAYHTWFKETGEAVLSVSSESFETGNGKPNILLITFDALTARDMSLYGYHRETTPFISKWAKNATVFAQTEAESNFTTPTAASLMTGKMVWTHQTYHLDGSLPVKNDVESLPAILKNNGYYNAAFIVNHHASVNVLGLSNVFDYAPIATKFMVPIDNVVTNKIHAPGAFDKFLYEMFGSKIRLWDWILDREFYIKYLFDYTVKKTAVPPAKAFNSFLETYNNLPEPFFVWIHVLPPHDPYVPPEPYKGLFGSSKENSRRRYDEYIKYCDKQFGDFVIKLTKKDKSINKLKNTIIILSSDHGESYQHDFIRHAGPHLYEQVTHIPLIIKEQNQIDGRFIDDRVKQTDIPATILEMANISIPSWMEGRSLVPLMRGEDLLPRPLFSMWFWENPSRGHQITKGTIAVWEGDYKLIHYLNEENNLLFDLRQDPDENKNLFDIKPIISHRLLTLIQDNLNKANEKIRKGWVSEKR